MCPGHYEGLPHCDPTLSGHDMDPRPKVYLDQH